MLRTTYGDVTMKKFVVFDQHKMFKGLGGMQNDERSGVSKIYWTSENVEKVRLSTGSLKKS